MTIHAYNLSYLEHTANAVGFMLDYAVNGLDLDGAAYLQCFIQSGIAAQIELGNPKYIAGKSGTELCLDVMEITTGKPHEAIPFAAFERSDVYWIGWILTYYQWYSSRSFKDILDAIEFERLLALYSTLHEADVQKCYEVFDQYMDNAKSKLKTIRKRAGYTQEELADKSGISVNTIRAYEQKNKDLSKARFDIVLRLSRALNCTTEELAA